MRYQAFGEWLLSLSSASAFRVLDRAQPTRSPILRRSRSILPDMAPALPVHAEAMKKILVVLAIIAWSARGLAILSRVAKRGMASETRVPLSGALRRSRAPARSVLPLVVKVDNVANDVTMTVHECDVMSYDHVLVVLWSTRQLSAEVARHTVGTLLQFPVEWLTGLQTLLLFGRELIHGSHAPRRIALMLVVPIVGNLTVVLVELLAVSILR
jgi:hypothetical protein